MHNRCRLAINSGRVSRGLAPMTQAQVDKIDTRLRATMRRLARTDPDWQTYSADIRMVKAGEAAMADIEAEAARKVANAELQALKTAEVELAIQDDINVQQLSGKASRTKALVANMERTHAYIDGVKRDNTRHLMDLIEAADDQQGASLGRRALMVLFDAQNPIMTRDLAMEVFAQGKAGTGNAVAKKGAEAWLKVTDDMRRRFNAAGGDVGQLDYGYLPQAHDQMRVLAKGRDKWAAETMPLLDRSRYLNEDGSRMSDADTLDVLRAAWDTISSDGTNKATPGAFKGTGARANRGSQSREIHFKDGEAYLTYQRSFGTGSMYDAMIGHIGGLARDIGLVERYGPNPEAQMRLQFDLAGRADGKPVDQLPRIFGNRPDAYWRLLSGSAGTPQSARIAQIGQHTRNIETFGKLQQAVLSSLTDLNTYFVTTGFNKLGYWSAFRNLGSATKAETREFLTTHGMIAESMISDLNRWAGENVAQSWSGRIANATMRLSLMNAWTDTLRRAFQLTMMQGIGRMRDKAWASLTEYDQWRLANKGITADDWEVIRSAQPEQLNGRDFITPDGIYATGNERAGEVVAKYLGMISDEAEIAVLNPDLATRAVTTGGAQRAGTIDGELWRAVAQFKSFPIAMISRHWRRMLETPQGLEGAPLLANRVAYAGAMLVGLTALGAIVFQAKQIIAGKDPVDMTGDGLQNPAKAAKFWGRAVAQGGGLGFVGDMLLQDTTDDRSPLDTFSRSFLGPSFGTAADLYELTKGNLDEYIAGKKTNAGAESLRFARSHLPLVNLWYAKAALDHAGMYALQENLSPGYLGRIEGKAKKDWQQGYWWSPRDPAPARAPDLGRAVGQ